MGIPQAWNGQVENESLEKLKMWHSQDLKKKQIEMNNEVHEGQQEHCPRDEKSYGYRQTNKTEQEIVVLRPQLRG